MTRQHTQRFATTPVPVQEATLLGAYAIRGAFADCYTTTVRGTVTLSEFIESFYTTPLFKVERWLLAKVIRRPSSDLQANALAHGTTQVFSAWRVEGRSDTEILLDAGQTRSWLCVIPTPNADSTALFFGSAVLPHRASGKFGNAFHALLGFHRLYSRLLLSSAAKAIAAKRCAEHTA
jgi:hypothetical protein